MKICLGKVKKITVNFYHVFHQKCVFKICPKINAFLKEEVKIMVLDIPDILLNKKITIKGLHHYVNCFYFLLPSQLSIVVFRLP